MASTEQSPQEQIDQLRSERDELRQTLEAIQRGEVDAVVGQDGDQQRVYTLDGADHAYRLMIEAMHEGAVMTTPTGFMQYCNRSFAALLSAPFETLLGTSIHDFVEPASRSTLDALLSGSLERAEEFTLRSTDGEAIPTFASARRLVLAGDAESISLVVVDLREQRDAETKLREAQLRYRNIFENVTQGIFQMDAQGQLISANPALARIYGFDSPNELVDELNQSASAPYVDAQRKQRLIRTVQREEIATMFESQVYRTDGRAIWITESVHPVHDTTGRVAFYQGNVIDITERKRNADQLAQYANYDTLTGLANRRLLLDRLRHGLQRARRNGEQLAVCYIDLDNFKTINDGLGHHLGDRLLKVVAQRLQSLLRENDTVARQGGDEFVVVLEQAQATAVTELTERLLRAVAQPIVIDQEQLHVTCSIGYSIFPNDGMDANSLLRHADTAMYQAKSQGRNNTQAFTEEMNRSIVRKLSIESALRKALKQEALTLNYQPQVGLDHGRINGAEALMRWNYGRTDEVFPSEFIPLAEETGLIVEIGAWALKRACRDCLSWQRDHGIDIGVSVNLSPRQFRDHALADLVASVLKETGLPAHYLTLEVTESLVMDDVKVAVKTIEALRATGIRLALDDFGTGHSSLSHLQKLPLDCMKIDKSFVQALDSDSGDMNEIALTIIQIGHGRGLQIVAEGIETPFQFEFLREHGCDAVQGFLISKAVPIDEFIEMYQRQSHLEFVPAQLA